MVMKKTRIPLLGLGVAASLLFISCARQDASANGASTPETTASAPPPPPPESPKIAQIDRDAIIADYESTIAKLPPVQPGTPEAEVLARLGEPDGIMTLGDRKRLSYAEGYVMTSDSVVAQISDIPADRLRSPDPAAYAAYQEALGKVFYNGRWMTAMESQAAYRETLQARMDAEIRKARAKAEMERQAKANARYADQLARAASPFRDIRRGGAAIELGELLVPGKITVLDFYADWCGPCRKIAPHLEKLSEDPQVVVRKIDIVNWKSPVARQWQLRSIPNMRVYDKSGKPVGKPTSSFQQIQTYVADAK